MLPNGPACTRTGVFSSVCMRFGLSASRMSAAIAPAPWMSSAVTASPSAGVADDDPAEAGAQLGEVVRQREHRHHLGRRGDVEAGLARHAVHAPAEAGDDVAQRAVVDVEHPAPGDAVRVQARGVALVEVVVEHRGEHVVRARDRVEVAGEVEVELLHRHDLRVAPARGAALDAERRPHRRLADRDDPALADVGERLTEADGGGRLALAQRRRGDRGHDDVLRPRPVGHRLDGVQLDLRDVVAVHLEQLERQVHLPGHVVQGLQRRRLRDVEVRRNAHSSPPASPRHPGSGTAAGGLLGGERWQNRDDLSVRPVTLGACTVRASPASTPAFNARKSTFSSAPRRCPPIGEDVRCGGRGGATTAGSASCSCSAPGSSPRPWPRRRRRAPRWPSSPSPAPTRPPRPPTPRARSGCSPASPIRSRGAGATTCRCATSRTRPRSTGRCSTRSARAAAPSASPATPATSPRAAPTRRSPSSASARAPTWSPTSCTARRNGTIALPADRIAGAVMLGSPRRDPRAPNLLDTPGRGVLGPRPTRELDVYDGRVYEVCAPGDPICATENLDVTRLPRRLGLRRAPLVPDGRRSTACPCSPCSSGAMDAIVVRATTGPAELSAPVRSRGDATCLSCSAASCPCSR